MPRMHSGVYAVVCAHRRALGRLNGETVDQTRRLSCLAAPLLAVDVYEMTTARFFVCCAEILRS
jgi:hypothetical protein